MARFMAIRNRGSPRVRSSFTAKWNMLLKIVLFHTPCEKLQTLEV